MTLSERERSDRVRTVFGTLIALAGLINLASALSAPLPERLHAVERVLPLAVPHVANVIVVQSGVLLLFLARQLGRGKRRAWQAAVALLVASTALHVVKALDVEEASVAALLAAGLVATRRHFRAPSDAPSFRRLLRVGPLLVAFPFAYGLAGLYLRHSRVLEPFSLWTAVTEVADRLVGLHGPLTIEGGFGRWFPASITVVGAVVALRILYLAFRPVVARPSRRTPEEERTARDLVAGDRDTLSYFLLRDDKALFFDSSHSAALGYRVVGGVALISGDPLGPRDVWPALLDEFTSYAHEHGWRVAALGVGGDALPAWESLGHRVLYIGDEAIIDPRTFSLKGRSIRKVRQACAAVEREGYTIDWHRARDVHPDLRRALVHISESWRGGDEERGFTMTLGRLCDRRDPDCLIAVGRDAEGYARAFLQFVPVGGDGYSLDVMRRDRDTPGGLNEWLIARTLEHMRETGVRVVSLNFAFLRGILRPSGRLSLGQRLQRVLAVRLGPWFQIESLYRFNNKFGPEWRARYAAYEDALAVPSVLLAALRAERLLDLSIVRRGQGGKRTRRQPVPA